MGGPTCATIALQSLCMRAGQITTLSIAFTGLLSAQTAPQGPMGPPAKIPPARIEKKSATPKLTAPVPIFRDIAAQAGLTASHISSREKYYVIESMSGGVGLFDCDNDGKLDIVMVNGSTVDRYKQGGDPLVTLWHQDAGLKFTDITEKAGLTRKGWGMGVAVADFDNDGNLDLFVTGYGGNALYRNKGNCTFEDLTDKAGVRGGRLLYGRGLGRLRPRRKRRFVCLPICSRGHEQPARLRIDPVLPVQRRARAVRTVGHGRRNRSALPQPRRRHV